MNHVDFNYQSLLNELLEEGEFRGDRTGTGTLSIFGMQLRIDLREGFPLLTTKAVHFPSIRGELLWMLSGSTNVRDLQRYGVTIWDEWADANGELGPVYGLQWRNWGGTAFSDDEDLLKVFGVDQIRDVIEDIKDNPESRRHVVTAWNPDDVPHQRLPPCHMIFQFSVRHGNRLACHVNMRSCDAFLGLPFNIAQYALLTHMVAQVCGLEVGDLIFSFGDLHLYENHVEQAKTQLGRAPRALPTLKLLESITNIDQFTTDDIAIEGYDPHPKIPAPVAV